MNEINKINLSEQTKDYFHQKIIQRKSCSKKLCKYITAFDYIDKILIVSSAKSSGFSIISSASVAGVPVGIARAIFTLIFSLTTGIIRTIRKSMIRFLCLLKLNLISLKL